MPEKNETQAVAKRERVMEIKAFLDNHREKLRQVASRPEIADAGLRFALVAINKTPALINCTPTSILQACMESVSLNLPPGPLGYGHFVPFGLKCQFIPDYKGLAALATRNGAALKVTWRCVYEGDIFEYDEIRGTVDLKRLHDPSMEEDGNGNEIDAHITHVYTAVTLANGAVSLWVMTRPEVVHIRNRYSQAWKQGKKDSPWFTRPSSQFIKTCFKQHSKQLDLGPNFARARHLDDMREIGQDTQIIIPDDTVENDKILPATNVPKVTSAEDALLAAQAQTSEGDSANIRQEPDFHKGEQKPPSEAPKEEEKPSEPEKPPKTKTLTPKQKLVKLLFPLAKGNSTAFDTACKQALGGTCQAGLAWDVFLENLTQKQLEKVNEAIKNPKPENGGTTTPDKGKEAATEPPVQQKPPSKGSEPDKAEPEKSKPSGGKSTTDPERAELIEFIENYKAGEEKTFENKLGVISEVLGSSFSDQALSDMAESPELIEDISKLRSVKNILEMMG